MGAATTQQDPVSVDPKHYTVELENDRVRVVRIRYGPGEKSEMHPHPESVIVFMTDAVARFSYPDGSSEEMTGTAGQIIAACDNAPSREPEQRALRGHPGRVEGLVFCWCDGGRITASGRGSEDSSRAAT